MKKRTILIFSFIAFVLSFCPTLHAEGKTGILMVHYGSNNDASRHATIDALDSLVAAKYPQCEVVEAYTAASVIKALGKRGIHKMTVGEALDTLKARGCTQVAVQSTMLLDGNMTDIIKAAAKQKKSQFETLNVGRALLYNADDCRSLTTMIEKYLTSTLGISLNGKQVVLVGHGSDSPANAVYSQIDYLLKDEGHSNWHVGTIEGYPTLDSTRRLLAKGGSKDVVLVPLLYIAGNHLRDDVDGEWRSQLEADGYTVTVVKSGLGKMPEIQQLIVGKIAELLK